MLLVSLAFIGWGRCIQLWLGVETRHNAAKTTNLGELLLALWLGLCVCISLTELLHFFFAINWSVSSVVLGLGLVNLLRNKNTQWIRGAISNTLRSRQTAVTYLYVIALTAIALIWIAAGMAGSTNYDSGLYHFGSIKWINEHSLTYGLVNLHTRLAYNQSYFALIALLNFSPLYDRAYAGAGALLFILTAVTIAQLLRSAVVRPIFLLLGLLVLLGSFVLQTSSPSPDLAVGLFQVAIFFILLNIIASTIKTTTASRPTPDFSAALINQRLILLILLCLVAVTMKLSMALFCFAAVCVVYRQLWQLIASAPKLTVKLVALASLMVLIHAARGYALSGMPFFPSAFAALWSLPYAPNPARVAAEVDIIYSWARLPGVSPAIVLGNWNWLGPWFGTLSTRVLILGAISSILFILTICAWVLSSAQRRLTKLYALYLPLLLGTLFWFFTAPDVRFLGVIPELAVILGGWLLWSAVGDRLIAHLKHRWHLYRLLLIALLVVLLLGAGFASAYRLKYDTSLGLGQFFYLHEILFGLSQIGINAKFLLALVLGVVMLGYQRRYLSKISPKTKKLGAQGRLIRLRDYAVTALFLWAVVWYTANSAMVQVSTLSGWVAVPTEPYEQYKLRSGVTVNIPKSDDLCWQTPLPCLPRQQLNEQLQFITLPSTSSLWPDMRMFKLDK